MWEPVPKERELATQYFYQADISQGGQGSQTSVSHF
jgi:hypothetical protein